MKIITDTAEIEIANNKATKHEGAYATCRVIDNEAPDCQEWAEHCEIDGSPAKIYYIFDNDECEVEEADEMPWDSDHISKIKIAEMDEDGDYENL